MTKRPSAEVPCQEEMANSLAELATELRRELPPARLETKLRHSWREVTSLTDGMSSRRPRVPNLCWLGFGTVAAALVLVTLLRVHRHAPPAHTAVRHSSLTAGQSGRAEVRATDSGSAAPRAHAPQRPRRGRALRVTAATSARPEARDAPFIPLRRPGDFSGLEYAQLVRVTLRSDAFGDASWGSERDADAREADILVGHDGVAWAVRWVK